MNSIIHNLKTILETYNLLISASISTIIIYRIVRRQIKKNPLVFNC